MIKRGILCVLIAVAVTMSGFADQIKVTGTAPTFKTNDPNAQPFIGGFNDKLKDAFDGMLTGIQDMIDETVPAGFIDSSSMLNGFGTSSVFSSHGATMRAYAEYKFLSISIGSMVGLQLPKNTVSTLFDALSGKEANFDSFLSDNLTFGVNPQIFNIHVGMKPSVLLPIIPKSLFLGLRLGFFGLKDLEIPISDANANLNFNTFTIGLTANYQLIPTIGLGGVLKWRGVNVGSGILIQTTKLDLSIPFDEKEAQIGSGIGGGLDNLSLVLDPRVLLNMNINTVTIPIEVMTAINLIFLNIPIGIGFDLGFGKSELSFGAEADVNIKGANSISLQQDKAGSLSAGIGNNDVAPSAFNFKIMTGLGFSFGDVFVIDIPITFYLTGGDGFNLGFTLGLRF